MFSTVEIMPVEEFLLPKESVRFQSESKVEYADKSYQVVVTDSRLILHASRGMVFKKDECITEKLSDIQVRYHEEGMVRKKGVIEVQGKTLFRLRGKPSEMKALYKSIIQFL